MKLLVITAQKGVSQENTFPPWNLQRMSAEAATCFRKPHGRLRAVYLVVWGPFGGDMGHEFMSLWDHVGPWLRFLRVSVIGRLSSFV